MLAYSRSHVMYVYMIVPVNVIARINIIIVSYFGRINNSNFLQKMIRAYWSKHWVETNLVFFSEPPQLNISCFHCAKFQILHVLNNNNNNICMTQITSVLMNGLREIAWTLIRCNCLRKMQRHQSKTVQSVKATVHLIQEHHLLIEKW